MKPFNTIDCKEIHAASVAVQEAADNHSPLSGYIGSKPLGGPMCLTLEAMWCGVFEAKHAVAVNSGTSGLLAACMAIGIEYGDEVIVSPYTMSATAAVPKILGAKIIFADIEKETFCLDPVEVHNAITRKTRAVIVTNLFGHPAHLRELRDICDGQGVFLIEDNAQAIFAKENGVYAGTIGHIGVFSLNVHKHLQVGEGGICVTNSGELNRKLREAMNHGEMRGGILGLNLRMTEVTAAMAIEQLKKADQIIKDRIGLAEYISHHVKKKGLPILPPMKRDGCDHVYYCWAGLMLDEVNVQPPFRWRYQAPLWSIPAFRKIYLPSSSVVEDINERMLLLEICSISPTDKEVIEMVDNLGRISNE